MNRATTPSQDRLLTATQVATLLQVSTKHVLKLTVVGILPALNVADPKSSKNAWRFRASSILAWVNEREQPGTRG